MFIEFACIVFLTKFSQDARNLEFDQLLGMPCITHIAPLFANRWDFFSFDLS